jgi:hypothetical protein
VIIRTINEQLQIHSTPPSFLDNAHLSIDTIFLFNDFFTATRGREKNVLIISSFIISSIKSISRDQRVVVLVVVCVVVVELLFFIIIFHFFCLLCCGPYGKEQHNNTTGQGRGGLDRTKENMKKRG